MPRETPIDLRCRSVCEAGGQSPRRRIRRPRDRPRRAGRKATPEPIPDSPARPPCRRSNTRGADCRGCPRQTLCARPGGRYRRRWTGSGAARGTQTEVPERRIRASPARPWRRRLRRVPPFRKTRPPERGSRTRCSRKIRPSNGASPLFQAGAVHADFLPPHPGGLDASLFVIVPQKVRHSVDDEKEDPLLLRAWPVAGMRKAFRRGKEDVPRDPGRRHVPRVFLGKREHVRRSLPSEEFPVPTLHLLVPHHEDSQVRPGQMQETEGPPDQGAENLAAKGGRPDVLPDADPVPLRSPVHDIPLAGACGYSTRVWETAERTLLKDVPTAWRSRSVMSHSLSCPSR